MKGQPWDLGLVGAAPLPALDMYSVPWFLAEFEGQGITGWSSDPCRCYLGLIIESERMSKSFVSPSVGLSLSSVLNTRSLPQRSAPLEGRLESSVMKGAGVSSSNRLVAVIQERQYNSCPPHHSRDSDRSYLGEISDMH
jgi:hypothetical protein